MAEALREKGRPWSEILVEVERAGIRQGTFEPLDAGCEHVRYRIRFVPKERPRVFSKEIVERLTRPAKEHSLIVQTRCTGYNFFLDTGEQLYGMA